VELAPDEPQVHRRSRRSNPGLHRKPEAAASGLHTFTACRINTGGYLHADLRRGPPQTTDDHRHSAWDSWSSAPLARA